MASFDTGGAGRRRPGWLIPLVVIGLIGLLVVLPLIGTYNDLVKKRNGVDNQFAQLDVQLQRRADLIPNLANAVKAALGQEQAVFGQIADARTRYASGGSDDAKIAAQNDMTSALSRLLVIVEQYPQLQSNQTIRDLMTQVEGTENRVAQERRQYNNVVTDYNNSTQTFPRNIAAGLFGFDKRDLLATPSEQRDAPQVDLGVQPNSPQTTVAR